MLIYKNKHSSRRLNKETTSNAVSNDYMTDPQSESKKKGDETMKIGDKMMNLAVATARATNLMASDDRKCETVLRINHTSIERNLVQDPQSHIKRVRFTIDKN